MRTATEAVVIGAGPAGLMAAETLALGGARVTVFERMPSAGRKLLLAGRGGLNLTHTEPFDRFLARYGHAQGRIRAALDGFGPDALRRWCEDLGEPTFVGTSGRVFPQHFKTSPLLRAWLRRLDGAGVTFRFRHRWRGWTPAGDLLFDTADGEAAVAAQATVLALGGASWPQLGSDGAWVEPLRAAGVATAPLRPSNCGFLVAWSDRFRQRFEGQPLKGVALRVRGTSLRGEMTVTRTGLEGGAIYAVSAALRDAVEADGEAVVELSLRPDLPEGEIARRLMERPRKQSLSTFLGKALKLAPVAVALLHEAAIASGEPLSALSPERLAARIGAVPVRLAGPAPIARAISTAGGLRWDELGSDLMLRCRPGIFAAGEMLDWEAPTGGYLLQGAFATGALAGRGALAWLARR